MAVCLEMAYDGLDRRPAAEFPFDGAKDAALLSRAEDPQRLGPLWPMLAALTHAETDYVKRDPRGDEPRPDD